MRTHRYLRAEGCRTIASGACRIVTALFAASAAITTAAAQDDRPVGALTRLTPEALGRGLTEDMDRCVTGEGCRRGLAQTGGTAAPPAVAVRTYYADLHFDASPERDRQVVMGNCLNQRLKIVVSASFGVSWDMREATRVSRWRGSVDPASGALTVRPDGVDVSSRIDGQAGSTLPSEATGDFAKSRISFAPCGAGQITVRN